MNNPSHNPEPSATPRALAETFGLLFVEAVPDSCFSAELSGPLPVEWARRHGLLPVLIDGVPSLLTSDPSDIEAHQKAALAVAKRTLLTYVGLPRETDIEMTDAFSYTPFVMELPDCIGYALENRPDAA